MKLLSLIVSLIVLPAIASEGSRYTQKPSRPVFHISSLNLQNRTLVLKGPVLDSNMDALDAQFKNFAKDSNEPIFLIIDSPGGSVDAGLRLINTMKAALEDLELSTICIVQNRALSMGAVIATFCSQTYMLPNSILLYHEAAYGSSGQCTHQLSRAIMQYKASEELNNSIADALRMPRRRYHDLMMQEWWIPANEAVSHGIVDGIIDSVFYKAQPPQINMFDLIFSQQASKLWLEHVDTIDAKDRLK